MHTLTCRAVHRLHIVSTQLDAAGIQRAHHDLKKRLRAWVVCIEVLLSVEGDTHSNFKRVSKQVLAAAAPQAPTHAHLRHAAGDDDAAGLCPCQLVAVGHQQLEPAVVSGVTCA